VNNDSVSEFNSRSKTPAYKGKQNIKHLTKDPIYGPSSLTKKDNGRNDLMRKQTSSVDKENSNGSVALNDISTNVLVKSLM